MPLPEYDMLVAAIWYRNLRVRLILEQLSVSTEQRSIGRAIHRASRRAAPLAATALVIKAAATSIVIAGLVMVGLHGGGAGSSGPS